MGEMVERAEGILRQVAANSPNGRATPELFAEKITSSYPDMIRPLIASWVALMFDVSGFKSADSEEKPAANERAPRAIQDMPLATERATRPPVASNEPLSPTRSVPAKGRMVPVADLPVASRPTQNPPRVPIAAIAAANQRLGQSLLDAWQIGGKKFGDCRVVEILEACGKRDRATMLMRAVVKDLPGQAVVRTVLTAAEAESRRKAALASQQPTPIAADEPEGLRRVG